MPIEGSGSAPPSPNANLARFLRKELLAFRSRDRLMVFGVFFLAALQTVFLDEAFFLLGVALAASLAVYVPVTEWLQDSDPMLLSLPVRRETVVVGRYLVALLTGGVGGVAWGLTGRILLPLLQAGRTTPAMWMTMEGVLSFVISVGLFAILFFPLYFRMGMGRGSLFFLAVSLVLLGLGYGTAGMAWGPAATGDPGLIPPSALIRTRVEGLLESLGPAGTLTMILVSLAVAGALSIRLSQRWFRFRQL